MSELKAIRKKAASNKNFILLQKSINAIQIPRDHKRLLKDITIEVYASAYMDGEACHD